MIPSAPATKRARLLWTAAAQSTDASPWPSRSVVAEGRGEEAGAEGLELIPVHGSDQVADVTGAGDTVIATFTLALAAGATFPEAARIANYAASVVVMKMGTATVSREELLHTIERDESLTISTSSYTK